MTLGNGPRISTMELMRTTRKSCAYRILTGLGILFGSCLILSTISAISNRSLPKQENPEFPNSLDKARLLEAIQLRAVLGDQVWPGWDSAEIPLILWNYSYEFLFGYLGQPPVGWVPIMNDDLMPDWQDQYWAEDIFLEDLLRMAIAE